MARETRLLQAGPEVGHRTRPPADRHSPSSIWATRSQLRAVQHELVALLRRLHLNAFAVPPAARLGDGVGVDLAAVGDLRQVRLLLLVAAGEDEFRGADLVRDERTR